MSVRIFVILITLLVLVFITEGTLYSALRRNMAWVALISTWESSQSTLTGLDFDASGFKNLDDWNSQRLTGMSAYLTGNCSEAAQAFDIALRMNPDDTMLLFFAGHAYHQCGYSSIAVDRWQRAGAAPELLSRCHTAFSNTVMDSALIWCQLAVATDPELSEGHVQLGRVYQAQHDHHNALENFERAAALDAQHQMVFFQIGITQRMLGNLQDAELNLRREIEGNPTYSGSWYVIGLIYFDQQKYVEAVDYLLTAIQLDNRRRTPAETYVLNAIKDDPTNAGAHYTLGRLYLEEQRYEEARQFLLEANRIDPDRFDFDISSVTFVPSDLH